MMLSERRHPPITCFQPITETTSKSFTMSSSTSTDAAKPEFGIRITQQPSTGIVEANQPFTKPLAVESTLEGDLIFLATLCGEDKEPIAPKVLKLGGTHVINGHGVNPKIKRSSSSTEADVEHVTFSDLTVPSKGTFTITVYVAKVDVKDKTSVSKGFVTTEPFNVV